MFDVCLVLLEQLCSLIPFFIAIWVLFDFIGTLIFDKR